MKLSQWAIVFVAIVAICLMFEVIDTHANVHAQEEGVAAEDNLSNALKDGMNSVAYNDHSLFEDESVRNQTIKTIKTSLCNSHGFNPEQLDKVMEYMPALIMIDWNGYYVYHSTKYTDKDGYEISKYIDSGVNYWSQVYGKRYIVKYSISNQIAITDTKTNKEYKGSYIQSYRKAGSPKELNFMKNSDEFNAERNHIIVSCINTTLNYEINTNTVFSNLQHRTYDITLPESDTDTARKISSPCIVGFWQDVQFSSTKDMLTVYAFGASEMTDQDLYYIQQSKNGEKYYYKVEQPDLTKYMFVGTMEECARRGANPGY